MSCIYRCFGATSWQPCFGLRGHRLRQQKVRGQYTATASADQQTATTEVPKSNKQQQQKKQSRQKNGQNAGGKDKKSELAVTPKSEDFARYASHLLRLHVLDTVQLRLSGLLFKSPAPVALHILSACCQKQLIVQPRSSACVQVVHRCCPGSSASQQWSCQWHNGYPALRICFVGVLATVSGSAFQGDWA